MGAWRRACARIGWAVLLGAVFAPHALAANLVLVWTAPGDDGGTGRAARYELRYSLAPITETTYATSWRVNGMPLPQPAGSTERVTVPNLVAGRKYYFALKSLDDAGNWSPISNIVQTTVPVAATGDTPAAVVFSLPAPNPAQARTQWSYTLAVPGEVSVDVLDVGGRRVRRLASGPQPAGSGQLAWDLSDASGRPVAAGLYLVRARAGERTWVQRLVIAR